MLYLTLDRIKPNMVLACDIINSKTNIILLRKGTILNNKHIDFIEKYGYKGLYILDNDFLDVVVCDVISNELKNKTLKCLKEFNVDNIIECARDLVLEIKNKSDIIFDLIDINSDNIYMHSLRVAQMAITIGLELGCTNNNLFDLALASLLHDYGKMCIDDNLRKKLQIYKEYAREYNNFKVYDYNLYPLYSFLLIKDNDKINSTVKNIILSHNIDLDNLNYSFRKNRVNSKVRHNIFGDIIHTADIYSEVLKNNYSKEKAIAYLKDNYTNRIDLKYLNILLNHIPIYYTGSVIKLDNGSWAIVKRNNIDDFNHPIVKTFDNKTINLLKNNMEIVNNQDDIFI